MYKREDVHACKFVMPRQGRLAYHLSPIWGMSTFLPMLRPLGKREEFELVEGYWLGLRLQI